LLPPHEKSLPYLCGEPAQSFVVIVHEQLRGWATKLFKHVEKKVSLVHICFSHILCVKHLLDNQKNVFIKTAHKDHPVCYWIKTSFLFSLPPANVLWDIAGWPSAERNNPPAELCVSETAEDYPVIKAFHSVIEKNW